MQEEYKRFRGSSRDSSSNPSSALSKGFKRPSAKAIKHGAARNLLVDIVRRAETKLMKIKEASHAQADEDVRMRDIAQELFHKPGTLLTQDEYNQIYEETNCEELEEETAACDHISVHTYRTYEGTCNNLDKTSLGATTTKFRRLIPPWYENGCDSPMGRLQHQMPIASNLGPFSPPNPSARKISADIVKDQGDTENPFTHIVMQWGQFLDHDMDLAPEPPHDACASCNISSDNTCEPIKIPPSDSVFYMKGSTTDEKCFSFVRSIAACGNSNIKYGVSAREQINDVTSYIDGSMVYGSTQAVVESLLELDSDGDKTGFMKTSGGGLQLPLVADPANANVICISGSCYDAGDVRINEQAGLISMHTLLVREHNRIAKMLKMYNSHWSGERVFQETRKIVGALIQKITYEDYLTKVIGPNTYNRVIGNYNGYVSDVDASIPNSFATAAYRYGHSLIRPEFTRYLTDKYENGPSSTLHLINSFFNISAYTEHGLAAVLRGLVTESSLRMDVFMNEELTTKLFFNPISQKGLDLASLNIQRQRDHGMPKYGVWVNFCQKMFPNLPRGEIEDDVTKERLMMNYGLIEYADLWLAGISEKRLDDSLIGPTFACIFGLTFRNSRDGDRFYYENADVKNEEGTSVFTPNQVDAIKESTLAGMICDSTGISNIQPDVFKSSTERGNGRKACSDIPSLDVSQWREDPCYIRINTDGVPVGASIVTFFNTYLQQHTTTETMTPERKHFCSAIACPAYKRLRVRTFGNGAANVCTAIANPNLPDDRNDKQNVYASKTEISEDFIDQEEGIYESFDDCNEDDATSAILFTCDASSSSVYYSQGKKIDCENVVNSEECRDDDAIVQNKVSNKLKSSTDDNKEMRLLQELKAENFAG